MYAAPSLSTCILSAIVAAVVATGVYDGALGGPSAVQFPSSMPQAEGTPAIAKASTTSVNRAHKGDRLDARRVVKNTTVVLKNVETPRSGRDASGKSDDGKPVTQPTPAPLQHCEALASPVSDPILGRVIGRCFV
jgi:hypothetical protein